ncbi:MAG: nitroreductase family protein [Mycoplasmoidaceae bacterium]
MNLIQAIKARHAVRHFDGEPISGKEKQELLAFIKQVNKESGLNMQLIVNEPKAFGGLKAKICNFTGCVNYLAIIGPNDKNLGEKAGYYGEQVVLKAQQLGLNSCWVALTFNKVKNAYSIPKGQKLALVVALGYGTTQGHPHQSKKFKDVVVNKGKLPRWFINGVKCALLAPTGRNQQGFRIKLESNGKVRIVNKSLCKHVDLGIVKYHFMVGSKLKKHSAY